jgi:hypothetical protein
MANESNTPSDELSELVPGNTQDIRRCLRWLERVDRRLRDMAGALEAALHAEALTPPARAVVRDRAIQQCHAFAELALEVGYLVVVSRDVIARVEPLLLGTVDAAHRLADAVREGRLGDEATGAYLSRLKAPGYELRKFSELLAHALMLREKPPPDRLDGGTDRLRFDPSTHTVTLDGTRHAVVDPKAYEVYRAIVERNAATITKTGIGAKVKGVTGQKTIPNLIKTLPWALRQTVKVSTRGYWHELPKSPEQDQT